MYSVWQRTVEHLCTLTHTGYHTNLSSDSYTAVVSHSNAKEDESLHHATNNFKYRYLNKLMSTNKLLYHTLNKVINQLNVLCAVNIYNKYVHACKCIRRTCICTDWQLTNSTEETRLSKTTDDLRHESRNTEFSFPFTVSVES